MKKLIAVLVGVLLLLPSLTMALEPFNKDLRYGMTKNAEVKRMQEFLRDEGLYKGAITGNYYTLTRDAVRKYQKNNGLKVTGLFDKVTRSKVNEGVVVSEEVFPTPVVDSSPSIPVGWISNGDGTWRAPEVAASTEARTVSITDNRVITLERQIEELKKKVEEQKINPTTTNTENILTKKATVFLQANATMKINNSWSIDDWMKGKNSDSNRKLIGINDPLSYSDSPINFYLNDFRNSNLRILVGVNNSTEESPGFICKKSGNKYWVGDVAPKDKWHENILTNYNELTNDLLSYVNTNPTAVSMPLKFEVTCTNTDGSTSQDWFIINITTSSPK